MKVSFIDFADEIKTKSLVSFSIERNPNNYVKVLVLNYNDGSKYQITAVNLQGFISFKKLKDINIKTSLIDLRDVAGTINLKLYINDELITIGYNVLSIVKTLMPIQKPIENKVYIIVKAEPGIAFVSTFTDKQKAISAAMDLTTQHNCDHYVAEVIGTTKVKTSVVFE